MLAVILAAGLGSRLGSHDKPKALVEVLGRPLIAYSLDALRSRGVVRLVVVVGHRAEQLVDFVTDVQPFDVEIIENPDFATTGSAASLGRLCGRLPAEPFLLLESDLIYHPGFLDASLATPDETTLMVAGASGSGDEVYVCVDGRDRVRYLGKSRPPATAGRVLGEFAGITRVQAATMTAYCNLMASDPSLRSQHYEEVLTMLPGIRAELAPGLPWSEVDTNADLRRAEEVARVVTEHA